ncbi:MAG: hypothetical protein AB1486_14350 [Planctomycetota bacterium]
MWVGNSLGTATAAVAFLGLAKASLPTAWGGTLLVSPQGVYPFVLAGTGTELPLDLPCEGMFRGVSIYIQVLELDPGASARVSFTPGLDVMLGVDDPDA